MEYHWYDMLSSSDELQQGDLINDCPIIIPPSNINAIKNGETVPIDVEFMNTIILSQSCDLVNGKIGIILVCPYYSLTHFLDNHIPTLNSNKSRTKKVEELKKGYLPGYHLLNKGSKYGVEDYQVVDFKNVYGIKYKALKEYAALIDQRIRLLPPYREHLSQAFARYFMRVGLPQDLIVEGY